VISGIFGTILDSRPKTLAAAAVKGIPSGTSVTSASLISALDSMHNQTLDGLSPPLTFTKGNGTAVPCFFTIELSGGRFTTLNGLKTECQPG
jgi:branched-chain amino acid transport system substrate-binding protein